jgi:hypothetical protein
MNNLTFSPQGGEQTNNLIIADNKNGKIRVNPSLSREIGAVIRDIPEMGIDLGRQNQLAAASIFLAGFDRQTPQIRKPNQPEVSFVDPRSIALLQARIANSKVARLPHELKTFQKSAISQELNFITIICPDFATRINSDGEREFTMDGIGDEIGFIGERVLGKFNSVLQPLSDRLGIKVIWYPGFARFEANAANAKRLRLDPQEIVKRIEASQRKFNEKLGISHMEKFPECFGIRLGDWDLLKNMLNVDDFRIFRNGALGNSVNDGRDWVLVILIGMLHDMHFLEAASFNVFRQMKTLIFHDMIAMNNNSNVIQARNMRTLVSSLSEIIGFARKNPTKNPDDILHNLPISIGLKINYK